MELEGSNRWGVLMRFDHPLAEEEAIAPESLEKVPLICSKQALDSGLIEAWAGGSFGRYELAGTYNLVFNGALMVEERLGCMLCYSDLVNVCGTDLRFRPLDPPLESAGHLVWKRGKYFSKAAAAFLELLEKTSGETDSHDLRE